MQDENALAEIRALSPEARGLILHRLRNSLMIASGNAEFLVASTDARIAHRALAACRRLDREITELFGQ